MKIAYCGYDFFSASLRELLKSGVNVDRIFTVPNRGAVNSNQYMKQIAEEYRLPISEERITEHTIRQLDEEGCDLLVTAAYNYKIPELGNSNVKGINVHPSLLPKGRGEWPLPWTILTKQQTTGITIHKLTQEYDAGDILYQKSIPVDNDETLESLSAKVQLLSKTCLLEVIADFENLWEQAKPQSGEVSEWGAPTREQRTINWQWSIDQIDCMCRAFGKFGCYASFDGQDWIVYMLKGWHQSHDYNVGDVVHKTSTEMIIAASDGLVSLIYFSKQTR